MSLALQILECAVIVLIFAFFAVLALGGRGQNSRR